MSKPAAELPGLLLGDIAPPQVARPANYKRSVFHLASGVFALLLLRLLPDRNWLIATSAAFVIAAWTMELSRRASPEINDRLMRVFRPIAHAHERHRVNSGTWYMTALLLLSLLAPLRAAEIGVVVLAVADPAAGVIGRRFGRTRLRAGRSLEGSLAFVAAGTLAAVAWLAVTSTSPWPPRALVAFAGATAGALAEIGSTRLDDNFTIPVTVTAAAVASHYYLLAA